MSVTIVIHTGELRPGEEPLSVTVDAPRVVIGRSKNAEVMLLEPTVAARHATLRQEGGRTIVSDEGSLNGIVVGGVKLPAHTPRVVGPGDAVRVGRVWLEIRQAQGAASTPAEARNVAMEVLRRSLRALGEEVDARLVVLESPNAESVAQRLGLLESGREYLLGRAEECDLVLLDELASRRHACVEKTGDRWYARDLGSKRGSVLIPNLEGPSSRRDVTGEARLDTAPSLLVDGDVIGIGATRLEFRDPLAGAMAESFAAVEVRMRREELHEPAPFSSEGGGRVLVDAPSDAPDAAALPSDPSELSPAPLPTDASEATGGAVDALVVLVALGVLAVSLSALAWLLR
ncbi:MAG: FHA domain-containing protein [Myxococcales bacterium]|nr:FHA domain-containing protein [Myxococcales bacterium]